MRLTDWPRMPFLNDEVKDWIGLELKNLGVEDLAVFAVEAGTEGDERRVLVATEVGILDHRYAPFGSSARYRLAMLLYPWQVLRGVELRADTFRLWAMEHRTRWSFKLHYPHFEAATESPELGQALCDLARVCAVMAEPFGVPAGRSPAHEASTAAIEVGGRSAQRAPILADDGSSAEEPEGEGAATIEAIEAAEAATPETTAGETTASEATEPDTAEAAPAQAVATEVSDDGNDEPSDLGDAEPMVTDESATNGTGEPTPDASEEAPAEESLEEQIGMVEMGEPDEGGEAVQRG